MSTPVRDRAQLLLDTPQTSQRIQRSWRKVIGMTLP
jgi:hypothetical protein